MADRTTSKMQGGCSGYEQDIIIMSQEKVLAILIILGLVIGMGAFIKFHIENAKYETVEAVVIDKYTTGGLAGTIQCIVDTGEKRMTLYRYCSGLVVNDKVEIELMNDVVQRIEIINDEQTTK